MLYRKFCGPNPIPKICLRCFHRSQDRKISLLSKADIGILQSPLIIFYFISLVVVDSNPSHNYPGKPLKNIIRVVQNIGFPTSPDRTKITPENIGVTIEKMDH